MRLECVRRWAEPTLPSPGCWKAWPLSIWLMAWQTITSCMMYWPRNPKQWKQHLISSSGMRAARGSNRQGYANCLLSTPVTTKAPIYVRWMVRSMSRGSVSISSGELKDGIVQELRTELGRGHQAGGRRRSNQHWVETVECYRCHNLQHFARNCPNVPVEES